MTRTAKFNRKRIDEENRTVEISFSSELAVERYFGDEILSHAESDVDFQRLLDGGPVLVDHDATDLVGVVDKVWLDDTKARAIIRFSKNERANEVFQDILDGIRKNVSVGYEVQSIRLLEEKGGKSTYLVDKWMPYELSLVSIPADNSVGVGRSKIVEVKSMDKEKAKSEELQINQKEAVEAATRDAGKKEADRVRSIYQAGEKFGMRETAETAVKENWDFSRFQSKILDNLEQDQKVDSQVSTPEIGMTDKEVKRFSFVKLINALASNDPRAQRDAAFEFECSQAAATQYRKEARGAWVPSDVLGANQRDALISATAGNLKATDLLDGSYIDLLTSKMPLIKSGHVKTLTGLVGDIAIPKQTGGTSTYWLAENANLTASDLTFGQVTMAPKTIGAESTMSRKTLTQTTPDIERLTRSDIVRSMALGLHDALINGTGASNQPTGLLATSGLSLVAIDTNGGALTYDLVEQMLEGIEVDDAEDGSLIYLSNPKVKRVMRTKFIDAGSGIRLWDSLDYPFMMTNQVPSNGTKGSGTNLSTLILGSFRENLMLGLWSGLDLTVDPYTNLSKGALKVVAFQDADIAVRNVEAFRAITDIDTTA